MARRTGHDPVASGRGRLLIGLRNAVDVRAERDDGFAAAPLRYPRGRHAGDTALDSEAVLFEDVGEVLRCLGFLHAEFTEGKDLIGHLLRELRATVDRFGEFGFQALDAWVSGGLCVQQRRCKCERGEQSGKWSHQGLVFGGGGRAVRADRAIKRRNCKCIYHRGHRGH